MNKIDSILGDHSQFLNRIFSSLTKDGIDVKAYELDHLCYRVETFERYEILKKDMEEIGTLLAETEVSGRPIASYKLNTPVVHLNRKISVIEIPAPKKNSFYPEGYEHAEFVTDCPLKDFMDQYRSVNFDTGALSKKVNAELVRQYGDIAVKFHTLSLEEVIKSENAE